VADGRLSYCKLCELADFSHPDLRDLIRDVWGADSSNDAYPAGEEHRKAWENAMSVRALRDLGALRPDAEILGVGAGQEQTVFWLTNHVRRVFATDLYLVLDSWSATDSGVEMLVDPGRASKVEWNPRRLVVQHMNALELRYEDESFDGIFSSGSIEHFGELSDIRRAVEEMYRVLKPGGVAAIATEFRLEGPPGLEGTVLFDEGELRSVVFDGIPWELASPLDLSMSDETLRTEIDWWTIVPKPEEPEPPTLRDHIRSRLGLGRRCEPEETGDTEGPHLPTPYPHIVLRLDEHLWTSVHVALVKPGSD
jgi:ubiquinone/menaquinone biosynthesis C-methylase UbiE